MPTVITRSSGTGEPLSAADAREVVRGLDAAYSRQRIEEVIRAVAEDALIPIRVDVLPWHDEASFEDDLRDAVVEIAETANALLVERLSDLLDSAPPALASRLAAAPRLADLA
jgi:hypothetical protein